MQLVKIDQIDQIDEIEKIEEIDEIEEIVEIYEIQKVNMGLVEYILEQPWQLMDTGHILWDQFPLCLLPSSTGHTYTQGSAVGFHFALGLVCCKCF